ncbi:MAG TPA: hypothetical protein VK419_17090 [Bryobacteraceae bacterium]|nr:hypothetical protein [Bryobacteraceae bacterium]
MRITSLAVLALLASGAAWAATRSETTTYVDGNLTGITPNTGGTLSFTGDNGITLTTGLATVAIPYSGIHHVELGAVKETSHDVPFYKVWDLPKRFGHKTQTQLLIVNFKNDAGEEKNLTLELAKASAESVLTTIQNRMGPNAANRVEAASAAPSAKPRTVAAPAKQAASTDDSWWGDKYWKTTSNQNKWTKPAAADAPDQR